MTGFRRLSEASQEHIGDLEDVCIAEQRLIEIRAGRSQTYTLEEVEQRLGFVKAVAQGLADIRDGHTVTLSEARKVLGVV